MARSNQGHTMTLHIHIPQQIPYQGLTSYTLRFLTYSPECPGQDFKGQGHYSKVKG